MIPEDWEVKRLGEVAEINMGQSPSSSNYNNSALGLPLVQGNADIRNRKTIIRNYTSQITKKCNEGDIIMSVRAPVGEIARTEFVACIGRGVCAISYPNKFIYHYLIFIEPQWAKYSTGSTFDSVNSDTIRNLEIPFPLKAEQTAIATALSDADALIQSLTKLIAKKRLIKQGAMQELLKPKEGWVVKRLGDVINLQGGYAFKSERFREIGIPIIRISNIQDGIVCEDDLVNYGEEENIPKEFHIKKGDSLIAMSGATTGKVGVYSSDKCAYQNQRVGKFVVRNAKNTEPSFIHHLVNSEVFKNSLAKELEQGAQPNVSGGQIEKLVFRIPMKEEQTLIATIISDMDAEITALQTKLDKYRQIKQGMMQELLTGRIQLI